MSSGVWTFDPTGAGRVRATGASRKHKALLHTPSGEVIWSYASLEAKLTALGWQRYHADGDDDASLQYHKRSSVDLISLPKKFADFQSIHMLDIVTKNRDAFRIIDADLDLAS